MAKNENAQSETVVAKVARPKTPRLTGEMYAHTPKHNQGRAVAERAAGKIWLRLNTKQTLHLTRDGAPGSTATRVELPKPLADSAHGKEIAAAYSAPNVRYYWDDTSVGFVTPEAAIALWAYFAAGDMPAYRVGAAAMLRQLQRQELVDSAAAKTALATAAKLAQEAAA